MPELITCPSCGCRFQVPQTRLGMRNRCVACEGTFVARPPVPGEDERSPVPHENELLPPLPGPHVSRPRLGMPLCPGCHRAVEWTAVACPYCGHPFAEEGECRPAFRRDSEPHRATLINLLGGACLAIGTLSVCFGPAGILLALATGVPALVMANRDLKRMTTGEVDLAGRVVTVWGQSKAHAGIALALVLGSLWALMVLKVW